MKCIAQQGGPRLSRQSFKMGKMFPLRILRYPVITGPFILIPYRDRTLSSESSNHTFNRTFFETR